MSCCLDAQTNGPCLCCMWESIRKQEHHGLHAHQTRSSFVCLPVKTIIRTPWGPAVSDACCASPAVLNRAICCARISCSPATCHIPQCVKVLLKVYNLGNTCDCVANCYSLLTVDTTSPFESIEHDVVHAIGTLVKKFRSSVQFYIEYVDCNCKLGRTTNPIQLASYHSR